MAYQINWSPPWSCSHHGHSGCTGSANCPAPDEFVWLPLALSTPATAKWPLGSLCSPQIHGTLSQQWALSSAWSGSHSAVTGDSVWGEGVVLQCSEVWHRGGEGDRQHTGNDHTHFNEIIDQSDCWSSVATGGRVNWVHGTQCIRSDALHIKQNE